MLKVIAWIIAIFLFLSTFVFVFAQNLRSILLTPEGIKRTLVDIDFYDQSKSIIKNDVLSVDNLADSEIIELSNVLNVVIDDYNFQQQAESTIEDFFLGLKNDPQNLAINYDLRPLKTNLYQSLSEELEASREEILASFPDQWRVELKDTNNNITYFSLIYRNNLLFLIFYFVLWLFLFLICLRIGKKYLKLFFVLTLTLSIFLFVQYILFYFIKPSEVIRIISGGTSQDITDQALLQGGSGVRSLVENTISYLRHRFMNLLIWESTIPIIVSILGLIIIKIKKIDNKRIPLNG